MDEYSFRLGSPEHLASTRAHYECEVHQAAYNCGAIDQASDPFAGEWSYAEIPEVPHEIRMAVGRLALFRHCVIRGKDRADTLLTYLASLPGYNPLFVTVKRRES